MTVKAPFPWYGGKRRFAPVVWERLGDPTVYVEPFAGSLAVMLARPGGAGPREIACDTDGGLINLWRALQYDPGEVAFWADYPTFHQDLTARHRWLRQWVADNAHRLSEDPHFFDAKAAGWWAWGISLWIGGGWCDTTSDRRPAVNPHGGGRTRVTAQSVHDQRPHVHDRGGGQGVSAQTVRDQIPNVAMVPGGQGVNAQRTTRPDLIEWFGDLQTRLKSVIVLNRPWQSALTPSLLQQTATGPKSTVGILMDPPYITNQRSGTLYGSDLDGTSDTAAVESYRWAVDNGDRFRIAYCSHEGDFPTPPGWEVETLTFGGIKKVERDRVDQIMFSPACQPKPQQTMFG